MIGGDVEAAAEELIPCIAEGKLVIKWLGCQRKDSRGTDKTRANLEESGMNCRLVFLLGAVVVAQTAVAADADNGKRVAQVRCGPCHIVEPTQRREVANSPPFESIARKFGSNPELLAFAILDPHPRMNLTFTRREVDDIAAYMSTLAK
jgi:mono/diheme cytochrome c family protein